MKEEGLPLCTRAGVLFHLREFVDDLHRGFASSTMFFRRCQLEADRRERLFRIVASHRFVHEVEDVLDEHVERILNIGTGHGTGFDVGDVEFVGELLSAHRIDAAMGNQVDLVADEHDRWPKIAIDSRVHVNVRQPIANGQKG